VVTADRAAWLAERRKGLGGSDIAAVAGLHPYKSAWSVYWDKVQGEDDRAGEAALWGRLTEDVIADEWARRHDVGLIELPNGVAVPTEEWRRGNPDRLVDTPGPDATAFDVLEVKTAGEWTWATQWDGGAEVPAWYQAQGQWYLSLVGAPVCHFAVLVGGNRLETRTMARNDVAIDKLVDVGRRFWHDHVLAGNPPPPDWRASTREKLDDLYPARFDRSAVYPAEDELELVLQMRHQYVTARANAKAENQAKDAAANWLVQYLGEREATDLVLGDDPVATYRPTRRLDVAALLEAAHDEGLDLDAIRGAAMREEWDTKGLERVCGRRFVDRFRVVDPARRQLRVPEPDEDT